MRVQKETYLEKCMTLLDLCRLTQDQLHDLEDYLVGKKEKDILEKLPYRNLGVSPKSYMPALTCLVSYGQDDPEQAGRLFNILFAIGGTSCQCLISNAGNADVFRRLLTLPGIDPAQLVAVAAEQLAANSYTFSGTLLRQFIDQCGKDPELIKRAYLFSSYPYNIKDVTYSMMHSFGAGQVYLLTAYFLTKYPDGKGPLEKDDIPVMQYYEDTLTDNLRNIYDTNTVSDYIIDELSRAIKTDQVTGKILNLAGEKYRISSYFLHLFGGSALLNSGLSDILKNYAKICFAANLQNMFSVAIQVSKSFRIDAEKAGGDYDTLFDINSKALILQAASKDLNTVLKTQFHKNRDLFLQVMETANAHDSFAMMEILRQEDRTLFLKRQKTGGDAERNKLIELLADKNAVANEVKAYLRGETDISTLYPCEDQLFNQYGYRGNIMQARNLLHSYTYTYHDQAFYNRVVSYILLCGTSSFFFNELQSTLISIRQLYAAFREEHLDMVHQLKFYSLMYQFFLYNERQLKILKDATQKAFTGYMEENREEVIPAFQKSDVTVRTFAVTFLQNNAEENKAEILSYTQDSSKIVREALLTVLCGQKSWEPEVLVLLSSKKAAERELAIRTLAKWDLEKYKPQLVVALEKEKNSKTRTLLQELLNEDSVSAGNALTLQDLVKQLHKGGKKRTLSWAYETPFSIVHKKAMNSSIAESTVKNTQDSCKQTADDTDNTQNNCIQNNASNIQAICDRNSDSNNKQIPGDSDNRQNICDPIPADEEYLQAILLCYASMTTCGVNKDAVTLAAELDEAELAVYVNELFDKWLALGAEAKKRWVLYAASIHGGTDIIKKLQHQINEWPQHSRGAIAADAVQALALNPKPEALLIVDSISRKFKFRQVKAAAGEALKFAADQLCITTEELADRIVPNLGFDENMERCFDYGERTFTVTITPALEVEVFDENGKKLKNIPAPGKKDDPEKAAESYAAFKEMKKQMKTTVASQRMRLELALSTERQWTCEAWKKLFVKNPIMHQFAIGLIWSIYEDKKLVQTFRYMEDGSFNTEDEKEFELPENNQTMPESSAGQSTPISQNADSSEKQNYIQKIGLVHPVELSEESIEAWKTQLEDYEITQPIEQLSRPVYHMTEKEAEEKSMERFGGCILNDLSLHGKMQNMGWYRGQAEDAGIFYYYYREDREQGLRAELNFSGSYVGGQNEDVTVLDVKFNKKIGELPERYFSEIVMQIAKAVASSQERDLFWKEKH